MKNLGYTLHKTNTSPEKCWDLGDYIHFLLGARQIFQENPRRSVGRLTLLGRPIRRLWNRAETQWRMPSWKQTPGAILGHGGELGCEQKMLLKNRVVEVTYSEKWPTFKNILKLLRMTFVSEKHKAESCL